MSAVPDPWVLPSRGLLDQTHRVLARLLMAYAVAMLLVAAGCAPWKPGTAWTPWAVEAWASGLAGLVLGSLLLAIGALSACVLISRERRFQPPRLRSRLLGRLPPFAGSGRLAQGVLVPGLAALAGALAASRLLLPAHLLPTTPGDPTVAAALAACCLVAAFPAVVAERFAASIPAAVLPEAPALRRLLVVPVFVLLATAGLEALRGRGLMWPDIVLQGVGLALAGLAAELAVRGLARWYQPPTDTAQARAPVQSVLADLPAWFTRPGGVAAPLRDHFGLDFSRSWALGYLRRAALPAAVLSGLACWVSSGVVLIPQDGRGVYERFGDPVAVFGPGLHATLPWPLGRVRPVEFGAVHEIPLGPDASLSALSLDGVAPAEAPAPVAADRLWDQPHPAEADWLIAGNGAAGQSFQDMSADIRVLYRIGLTDADAEHALYNVAEPDLLVREVAGRVISRFFAARTLDSVLDQRRELMAEDLQAALADALDRPNCGLEVVSVTVEAVHPPAGAAAAYHAVQAAEIIANTSIASETGRARGTASMASAQSWDVLDKSRAAAAETVAFADADGRRFQGDRAAKDAGGRAFLLERYFQTVAAAMGRAPLTIVDHRVAPSMAPAIDLRPFAAAARTTDDGD